MTHTEALEVKQILMDCNGTIPATHVDRVYHYYRTHIDSSVVKPCTCQPKYWNQFLIALRDKVEQTLTSYEVSENQQQTTVQEEETVSTPKRGRKKRSTGTV
jgi:hypothetical protein